FQVARRVYHQTGMAQAISHGLGSQADHFSDGWHVGGGIRDVGQVHLLDQPRRVHQRESPLGVVGRVKVGTRRPLRRGTATATCDVALATNNTINLVWRDSRVVHGLLAGQYGVGTQGLVHRDAVPTPVNRGMTVPGNSDFAPVLPDPQTVFISPPG